MKNSQIFNFKAIEYFDKPPPSLSEIQSQLLKYQKIDFSLKLAVLSLAVFSVFSVFSIFAYFNNGFGFISADLISSPVGMFVNIFGFVSIFAKLALNKEIINLKFVNSNEEISKTILRGRSSPVIAKYLAAIGESRAITVGEVKLILEVC